MRLLRKQAKDRYASADDLYEALDAIRHSSNLKRSGEFPTAPKLGTHQLTGRQDQPHAFSGQLHTDAEGSLGDEDTFDSEPSEPLPDAHADTLVSQEFTPKPLKLELDLSREAPAVHSSQERDEHDEDDDHYYEPSGKKRRAVGWLVLGLLLGLGFTAAYFVNQNMTPAQGSSSADPIAAREPTPSEPQTPPVNPDKLLMTGKVLGLITSAEELIASGQIEQARRALDTATPLIKDEDLPPDILSRRQAIARALDVISPLLRDASAAKASADCDRLMHLSSQLRSHSEGLYKHWRAEGMSCIQAAQAARPTAPPISNPTTAPKKTNDLTPAPKQPETKPPVEERPVIIDAKPDPIKEEPPRELPKPEPKPDPEDEGLPPKQLL
jgi:hypothetical protein